MARVLKGLAALLGLVLIMVGLPVIGWIAGGSPIPTGVPSFGDITDALTQPDDGTLFLVLLKYVGWIAWTSFAVMVLLELVSRVRGVRAPRLPGLGVQQRAAAGLVGAVLVLFTAAPVLNGGAATAAPINAGVSQSTTTLAQDAGVQQVTQDAGDREAPAVAIRVHEVEPGESLYSIAERLLDDGGRWKEIADLNYGLAQPDGAKLTQAHWIQPGWQLQVPVVDQVTVKPGQTLSEIARDQLGDADRYPELFDASRDTVQPGGARLSDPNILEPGWRITIPQTGATGSGDHSNAGDQNQDRGGQQRRHHQPQQDQVPEQTPEEGTQESPPVAEAPPATVDDNDTTAVGSDDGARDASDDGEGIVSVRTVGGVGALLAAGLLGLIAARRREQQRRRKPGAEIPMPSGEAAVVEQELRTIGDPISVELVDQALRTLAKSCADAGRPLPRVRAARLTATADHFDLFLAEPSTLPAPWVPTVDESVWTLTADAEEYVTGVDLTDIPAPYPALVTVGHDEENGHVLLDLEYLGALGITGDTETTRQVMAALAVELATSRWADDLQVTIVGAYSELEGALETGRVRYLPAVGRLIDQLTYRAERDRDAITRSGAGDLNEARVTGAVPGTWTPEIVLLPGHISPEQREALAQLVEELPRVAVAAVTSGEAVGQWSLRMSDRDSGVLEPFGLQLRPQMLDDATYAQVLQVLAVTDDDDENVHVEWVDHEEPTLEDVEQVLATAQQPEIDDGTSPTLSIEEEAEHQVEEHQVEDHEPAAVVEASEVTVSTATAAPVGDEAPVVDEAPVEPTEEDLAAAAAVVTPMQPKAPRILMLGEVDVVGVDDAMVEPTRRKRLTELAAILTTHPGCDHTTIDACYYPGQRVSDNTRNTQMSKLRRWMGKNVAGDDYLPRYQAQTKYRFDEAVTSDWHDWQHLLPNSAAGASSSNLEQALALVRGKPFDGVRGRRYGWAEGLKQQMISAIVDAAYELTRRQIMEGKWLAAETTALVGLMVEPGTEPLWRMRIIALHARGNSQGLTRAVDQLLELAEDWGGELEPETEELLEKLQDETTNRGDIVAGLG